MPNRILKESICTSDTIGNLSWFEEVLFYRLIVNCDDYGRFDGRPPIIRGRLFPLKTEVTEKTIANAIYKLSTVGLVMPYEYDGKPILQLVTWDEHQSVRNKRSRYPGVDGSETITASRNVQLISENRALHTDEINCNQLHANVPVIQSNPNPIQSESESNPDSVEPQSASAQQPAIMLPLNDGTEYPIEEAQVTEWAALFPAVDAMQELRSMRAWLLANPKKRKTRGGILRFVTGWLAKEQDRGGTLRRPGTAATGSQSRKMTFAEAVAQAEREIGL